MDNLNETLGINYLKLISQIYKIAHYSIQIRIENNSFDIEKAVQNESWDWGAGVLMIGLLHAYEKTSDETIFDFVKRWIDYHIDKGVKLSRTDHIAPAAVVAEAMIYGNLVNKSERYKSILEQSHKFLINAKKIELKGCKEENGKRKKVQLQWRGRTWLDDLFMTVPFMIRYSKLFDKPTLQDTITEHFLAHRDFLQCHKRNSQLLKHGDYLFKDYRLLFWMPSGNVSWARGNGWYVAALADFLSLISRKSKNISKLINIFQNLIKEIATYQLQTGLFPTVLDDPSSYGEVSATALFVYAAAIGIKNKWLKEKEYYYLINNGVRGILKNVRADGRVEGTSAGTGVLPCAFLYKIRHRGTYPWGEGSVLMAFVAVANLFKTIQ